MDDQRKRWHSLRTICNAILWINRTGAQWRELNKLADNYPPWQTVYYSFRQFKLRGVWEELLDSLVVKERKRQQREDTPSLLAIDSQSVKIMQFIAEQTGIDGHKLINGRKRSIAVDRLGLPWALAVTSANTSDNEAGRLVVDRLKGKVPRLKMIAADHGYKPGRRSGEFCGVCRSRWLRDRNRTKARKQPGFCAGEERHRPPGVGRSSEALAAVPRRDSISDDGCFGMWRKP